jgi:glycosyltransferase involved in cell wall biosynthesis
MSRPRLRLVSSSDPLLHSDEFVEPGSDDDTDRIFVGRSLPALHVALIDARRPAAGLEGARCSQSFYAIASALARECRVDTFARSRLGAFVCQRFVRRVARKLSSEYDIAYVFGVPYGLARARLAAPRCSFIVHIGERDLPDCTSAEARNALACADAITTSSEPSRRRLQQVLPALSKRLHVIRPGANEEFLTVPSRPGQSQNVLCVGTLSRDNDIQGLLLAFTHVASTNPQTQLTLLGDPVARSVQQHACALGSYVRIEPLVPSHVLGNYYARAGIFVLPSLSGDFAATGLLDAMAAGLPVVCARTDVTSEIVIDAVTGFLIEPSDVYSFGNTLRKLLDDPALRRQIGAAARFDVARRFTWGHCFRALHRLRRR